MPRPLGHVKMLFSSRVLFDLEEAHQIFLRDPKEYEDYMLARGKYADAFDAQVGGRRLKPGPMWNLATAAFALNDKLGPIDPKTGELPFEHILVCRDTQRTAAVIYRNITLAAYGMFERATSLSGMPLTAMHHKAWKTDIFFTRNSQAAQQAVDLGVAAAVINPAPAGTVYKRTHGDAIDLDVDGDCVVFGGSSERYFRRTDVPRYKRHEFNHFARDIESGPFTNVLAKITALNNLYPRDQQPVNIKLVTARGGAAGDRVFKIADQLKIEFNAGTECMGGAAKIDPLEAHRPDLFLDDQETHLKSAWKHIPTGLVPYPTNGPMAKYLAAEAAKKAAAASAAAPAPRQA